MAEIVGLAASIVQLGGAGIELSKSLYTFVSSAVRAESEISDLAGDVKLTCSALERVGQTLKSEDTKSALTQRAVSDAAEIKQRCESVFAEISGIIEKRWKVDGNGKRNLSLLGKASWPLKEQKVELLRRRLDSLKFSLSLLLSVLQLAHEQARGKLDADLEKERYTVRELHKQRQRALQREQALEEKLKRLELHQDVTASATTVAAPLQSAAPTIANIATNVIVSHPQVTANDAAMIGIHSTDSDTSDADATSTDDKGEHFTLAELALCASHIEDLLKRITDLQKGLQTGQLVKHHRKRRMHKTYLRICRKIESNFLVTSTSSPTAPLPPSRANNHRFPPKLIVKPDRINCGTGALPDRVDLGTIKPTFPLQIHLAFDLE
ncbi:hypothetical protein BU25DRAFT_460146 [Macroventuria anomochaeta]|uniref:Uncharacterized protein n=1 Tax=Macroventuria anomochaeta TaxID=301207 RepID=A0ACB6RV07_9PLEO|nr:uncharacterized protein BU25DRAFT_460146 [Macroventuria anomochaeta]KAF2625815.1 hypothetical protein BU25DRAFT_460146 [Macroventuria anomochaeta]